MGKPQRLNGLSINTRINAKKHLSKKNAASVADADLLVHLSIIHPLHEGDMTASFLGRILRGDRVRSSARTDWEWFNTCNY